MALEAEPPHQAGRAHVERDKVEVARAIVETQVVDTHHLASVDVHDLAIKQVLDLEVTARSHPGGRLRRRAARRQAVCGIGSAVGLAPPCLRPNPMKS